MAKPEKHVFVCVQSRPPEHPRGSCAAQGAQEVMAEFGQQFEQKQLWGRFLLSSSSCIGTCDHGPSVLIYPEGALYVKVTKEDVTSIIDEHLLAGRPLARLKAPADVW